MSRGIYVALSGAVAQENALDATATNLANASTAGYQRQRAVFREVLAGASRKENLRYAAADRTALDTSRGVVRPTGRALDVALPEGVYLAVTTPRGERFTRAGGLTMTADGKLRTAGGALVAREDGKPVELRAAAGEPSIAPDGSITQGDAVVGKLRLVRFADPSALAHEGAGLLTANGAAPAPATNAALEIGALEESNASPVNAMTELVATTRTFEAFQKMIDAFGEMDRRVLTTVPNAEG